MPSAGRGTTGSTGLSAPKSSKGKLEKADALAAEAARRLGIDALVAGDAPNADAIFGHIENCEKFIEAERFDRPDDEFVSMALEIVDELIEYSTSEPQLAAATHWLAEQAPARPKSGRAVRDPVSTLALLTLIYIANIGLARYRGEKDHEPLWVKIDKRVDKLK